MNSFSREARLRSSKEFRAVLRSRCRRRGACCELVVSFDDAAVAQLGLIVSRRVGNAVQRNTVKRHCREWFRAQRVNLPGGKYVLRALPRAAQASGKELQRELTGLVKLVKRPA